MHVLLAKYYDSRIKRSKSCARLKRFSNCQMLTKFRKFMRQLCNHFCIVIATMLPVVETHATNLDKTEEILKIGKTMSVNLLNNDEGSVIWRVEDLRKRICKMYAMDV